MWEKIPGERTDRTLERFKIPHGWLVRTITWGGTGLTFVPDLEHRWQLDLSVDDHRVGRK